METLNLGINGLDQIELIGRGGSSRVYRARQIELDRLIAIKVINASDDSDVVRRFDRERKAMGRLSLHEGIVPIYSTGLTEVGEPYLIMPYYPNGSLQDRLERGPVPWPEAVEYMTAVASTLSAAHQSDVVHLDLKPANLLLTANGAPRIADFGIAKLMSDQAGTKTTGAAFTPTFSAPEALLGEPTSPASDVYGLGATLWALIAGRPPFRDLSGDNTLMAVVGRVVHHPVPDLRHQAPDPVCSVIETAMAKKPEDRYPTAGAFAQALTSAAAACRTGSSVLGRDGGNGHQQARGAPALFETAAAAAVSDGGNGPAPLTPGTGRSLRFDQRVPPPFVPAAPGAYDPPDQSRATWLVLAGGAVVVAVVALFTALTLIRDTGDETTPTTAGTPPTSGATTSSTSRGALAGASASSVAGPTTVSTTVTSVASSTGSATSAAGTSTSSTRQSTTSSPSSTTTTRPATSQSSTSSSGTAPSSSASVTSPSTSTTSTTASTTTSTTTATAPAPPSELTGTYNRTRAAVVLTWRAPDDATGVQGYTVTRNGQPIATLTRAQRTFEDLDVVVGETYLYRVRSDGAELHSGFTPAVSVDIPPASDGEG